MWEPRAATLSYSPRRDQLLTARINYPECSGPIRAADYSCHRHCAGQVHSELPDETAFSKFARGGCPPERRACSYSRLPVRRQRLRAAATGSACWDSPVHLCCTHKPWVQISAVTCCERYSLRRFQSCVVDHMNPWDVEAVRIPVAPDDTAIAVEAAWSKLSRATVVLESASRLVDDALEELEA